MDINDRVKIIRKSLNLNQTDFAKRIGIKQTTLSSIEIGIVNLTDRNLQQICRVFRINESWLRTGEGQMHTTLPIASNASLEEYQFFLLEQQLFRNYLSLPISERTTLLELICKVCDGITSCNTTNKKTPTGVKPADRKN